jgi:hypothetical protein
MFIVMALGARFICLVGVENIIVMFSHIVVGSIIAKKP